MSTLRECLEEFHQETGETITTMSIKFETWDFDNYCYKSLPAPDHWPTFPTATALPVDVMERYGLLDHKISWRETTLRVCAWSDTFVLGASLDEEEFLNFQYFPRNPNL